MKPEARSCAATGVKEQGEESPNVELSLDRCRANMACIRQSRPDSGLGLGHFVGNSFENLLSFFLLDRSGLLANSQARSTSSRSDRPAV